MWNKLKSLMFKSTEKPNEESENKENNGANFKNMRVPGQKFIYQSSEWVFMANFWTVRGNYLLAIYAAAQGPVRPMFIKDSDVVSWLDVNDQPITELINGSGSVSIKDFGIIATI